MSWKNAFQKGQELVLATCSKDNIPNANIVLSMGIIDNKLLVADSQMDTTLKNLQDTKKICIFTKKDNKYYKVKGEAEIYNSGKYMDICNQSDKKYPTKNAILVTIKEVFDLDKAKKIL